MSSQVAVVRAPFDGEHDTYEVSVRTPRMDSPLRVTATLPRGAKVEVRDRCSYLDIDAFPVTLTSIPARVSKEDIPEWADSAQSFYAVEREDWEADHTTDGIRATIVTAIEKALVDTDAHGRRLDRAGADAWIGKIGDTTVLFALGERGLTMWENPDVSTADAAAEWIGGNRDDRDVIAINIARETGDTETLEKMGL